MSLFDDEYSYCNVIPADDSIIPAGIFTSIPTDNQFYYYIKIDVEIIHYDEDHDDDVPDYMNMEVSARDMEVCVPVDQVIGTDQSRPHISRFLISHHLCRVGIPTHVLPLMIDQISSCARRMELDNRGVGRKVLPMSVFVSYITVNDEELDNERDFVTVGASEAAVEGLEKVKVEEGGVNCSICLEEFKVGEEGRKMDCEHCFHGDCIVRWLRVRNACPNCRFQLPEPAAEIIDNDDDA